MCEKYLVYFLNFDSFSMRYSFSPFFLPSEKKTYTVNPTTVPIEII